MVLTFGKVNLGCPEWHSVSGSPSGFPTVLQLTLTAWPNQPIFISNGKWLYAPATNEFWPIRGQKILNAGLLWLLSCVREFWQKKKMCIPVQITPGNQNYYYRYVSKIWSVYDSTDMLYGLEFEGWQLSNWHTKQVSWRVNFSYNNCNGDITLIWKRRAEGLISPLQSQPTKTSYRNDQFQSHPVCSVSLACITKWSRHSRVKFILIPSLP